jgi:hypothetical protein
MSAIGITQAALTPSVQADLNAVNAAGRIVYLAGSEALQPQFTELAGALFPGAVTRFADVSTQGASRNYEAALGVAGPNAGAWAGQKVLLIYRVKGGPTATLGPTARGESVESLNVSSALCGSQGTGTASTPYNCPVTGSGTGRIPDAVLTDSNPSISSAQDNLAGEGSVVNIGQYELGALNSFPLFSLLEGVAVTNTVGSNVKLNRASMAAIMSANVVNWSQVSRTEPANEDIVVCLHTPGSGTRTASNVYFNRIGCADGTAVPDRYSNDVNVDGTPKWDETNKAYTIKRNSGGSSYIENSSSADVRACLNAAVSGGAYYTGDRSGNRTVRVEFVGGGHRAIGILPLDNLLSSTPTGAWQFRSLDGSGKMTISSGVVTTAGSGKFPTQENHLDGTWEFTSIPFLNIPQRASGAQLDFMNFLAKTAGSPALMASFNDLSLRRAVAAVPARVEMADGTLPPPSGEVGSATNNVLSAVFSGDNQCSVYQKNYY